MPPARWPATTKQFESRRARAGFQPQASSRRASSSTQATLRSSRLASPGSQLSWPSPPASVQSQWSPVPEQREAVTGVPRAGHRSGKRCSCSTLTGGSGTCLSTMLARWSVAAALSRGAPLARAAVNVYHCWCPCVGVFPARRAGHHRLATGAPRRSFIRAQGPMRPGLRDAPRRDERLPIRPRSHPRRSPPHGA